MARQSRLFQRDGKWTFRAAIPADVRAKIGKQEIWKSFGTVSFAEARRLAHVESVKVDALVEAARSGAGDPVISASLSDAQILAIAQRYLYRLESSAEAPSFDPAERAARIESARQEAANLAQGVDDATLQRVAMRVAAGEKTGIAAPSDLLRITEAVQRALIEHYSREEDRALLRPEGRYDPVFTSVGRGETLPVPPLTLAEAIKQYKADPERANVAKRTRGAYEFRYALLEELLGPDREVAGITRADVREVREILLKLPPHAGKRFEKMRLRDVAEMAAQKGIKPMSPKSVTMYIEALSALFKWLAREEMTPRNPAVGLKGPALPEDTGRRPFAITELNELFRASLFGSDNGRPWRFWLPRIALYTGARFGEIVGLRVSDVVTEDGILCFSIVPNEFRELKTKGSQRLVPVHPALIEAGFHRYLASTPNNGLLFPDVLGPKDMVNARNKEMGRALRGIFADKALVFHGFRHTFKDAAARARIPRDIVALLGGWDLPGGRTAMDSYGRDRLSRVLADEIGKIRFEGVSI